MDLMMDTELVAGRADAEEGGIDLRLLSPATNGGDFDGSFEPVIRSRSHTWPCRPNSEATTASCGDDENRSTPTSVDGDPRDDTGEAAYGGLVPRDQSIAGTLPVGAAASSRKAAARRNAWGNLSYADLITRAIESSPEKRLTLSQIYNWMVENVPFFKDKGDSNSSAGWKNSIRHNLSLHSKFMRVQNESTGKSSWWVINPDVKMLKTPRRRAATMDNTKVAFQHRRNRHKRFNLPRVPSSERPLMAFAFDSSLSDHFDGSCDHMSPEMMTMAPQNYRVRSSSNASSIGRLSPILATAELDGDGGQFGMPLPSSGVALTWNAASGLRGVSRSESFAETLSESLASILVEDSNKKPMLVGAIGDHCHGNVMISTGGSITAQNRNIMTQNGTSVLSQNGANIVGHNGRIATPPSCGNIMAQDGGNMMTQSRNIMASNGVNIMSQHRNIMPPNGGPPVFSPNPAGMDNPCSIRLATGHNMWPVCRGQQPIHSFSSPCITSIGSDANKKLGRYDVDSSYPTSLAPPVPSLAYYSDSNGTSNGGHMGGSLHHSPEGTYSQFGVQKQLNNTGSQYRVPTLIKQEFVAPVIKQEPRSSNAFYAEPNGPLGGGVLMQGSTMPIPNKAKTNQPSVTGYLVDRSPAASQWTDPPQSPQQQLQQLQQQHQQQHQLHQQQIHQQQLQQLQHQQLQQQHLQQQLQKEQQQQQQLQQQQSSVNHSLGVIDPKKLMKILAEKPHLKEKMLQLIQQKRQQLAVQQQQQHPNQQHQKMNTSSHLLGKQVNPTNFGSSSGPLQPPPALSPSDAFQTQSNLEKRNDSQSSDAGSSSRTIDLMPVDLDLDFDTTSAINCDINQVIQHEMTFGDLDFNLDQLQVTLASSKMEYESFHF